MRKASLSLILLFMVPSSGCADVSSPEAEGLRIRSAAAASCEQHGNNNNAFPVGADSFVVRLSGAGLDEPFVERVTKDGDGPYVLTGIPPAENLVMDLVACNGSVALSAGRTAGVTILEHQKSFPPIFLTPIGGQTACVEADTDAQDLSHAFGSALRIEDTVFVLGGLGQYSLDQSVGVGKANDRVSTYERLVGTRSVSTGTLVSARAMATSYVTSDNKIRLIGGANTINLNTPNFDLWPAGGSAPDCGIELWDPQSGTSTCEYNNSLPAGGSGVALGADLAVYVGGVDAGGEFGVASDKAYVVQGSDVTELTMPQARVGASVSRLSSTEVLIWGGNFDGDAAAAGLLLDTSSGTITALNSTVPDGIVTMWAASVYAGSGSDGTHKVLVAGGTDLSLNGGYVSAPIPPSAARLILLTIGPDGVQANPVVLDETQEVRFKRVAASLFDVGNGEFWLLGGVTSYSKDEQVCPGASSAGCFPDRMARFSLSADGTRLAMGSQTIESSSVGSLGAIAVDLGDESSLVIGGLRSASADALDTNAELVRYGSSVSSLCDVQNE
jgi:hypothetical protein